MHNTESNLKQVLMEMGNRLVSHGFEPGPQPLSSFAGSIGSIRVPVYDPADRRTSVITLFTEFVNFHPEAQQILKDMGFDWPVVKRPDHVSHK